MRRISILLAVLLFALSLTGCLVSEEEQQLYDYVIKELIDEGYIGEDDELYCDAFSDRRHRFPRQLRLPASFQ